MPFISGLASNVFMLRWQHTEYADGASIVQCVKAAKILWPGPLVYVAIVPAGESPPDTATRRELGRRLEELLGLCTCIHLVLEGEGFRAATKRAAATGIFLMTGRRGRVTAHASVSEALICCPHLSAPLDEILVQGRSFGAVLEDTHRRAAGIAH
jgi:hypothetical protein